MDNHKPEPAPSAAMTDTDIVAALRSDDPKRRLAGLTAICGPVNGGVLLICTPRENRVTATNNLRPDSAFLGLLFIASQIGKMLGLQLDWVPKAPPQDGLIVAPGGSIPPMFG